MMQVAIYGRLGIDPEARTTRNDKPMATASIAVDAKLDSSDRQETIWLSVLALEKLAEAILRHQQGDGAADFQGAKDVAFDDDLAF